MEGMCLQPPTVQERGDGRRVVNGWYVLKVEHKGEKTTPPKIGIKTFIVNHTLIPFVTPQTNQRWDLKKQRISFLTTYKQNSQR